MIRARVVADEVPRHEVHFDAEPWFNQAPDVDIRHLLGEFWSNCEAADYVMLWIKDHSPNDGDRKALREFSALIQDSDFGYEVYINDEDAEKWIWNRDIKPSLDAVDYLLGRKSKT